MKLKHINVKDKRKYVLILGKYKLTGTILVYIVL